GRAAMMSQEQNDLITRTGPKDACGKLMRMYWQPAALVDELQGPRPVKAVKLLGENLVLFRDEQGRYGLIERHCAHRGADLAFGGHINCNWLQALEVGIDPAHASFLHRFFEDEDTSASYGRQFRGASAGTDMPMTKILREYDNPIINVEHTEYGLRLIALREIDGERTHVRVTNQLFPHGFVIPLSTEMTISQWHVPVDDENCYWYAIFTSYS